MKSILVIVSLASLAFACGMMNHDMPNMKKDTTKISKSDTKSSVSKGLEIYENNCISCHGKSAKGNGSMSSYFTPRPANLVEMAEEHTNSEFVSMITNGKGSMPAWKDRLSKDEIKEVATYIKLLASDSDIKHSN